MAHDARKGDWVQIRQVILEPGKRAPQVPEDTMSVPLTALARGFLMHEANLGEEASIETLVGRRISGTLVSINPGYQHSFGPTPKGFMSIGTGLRRILRDDS